MAKSFRWAICTSLLFPLIGCRGDVGGGEPEAAPSQVKPPSQSSSSTEDGLRREEHDRIPPGPPGLVEIERVDGSSVVAWAGTRDDTIAGYVVYRRCTDGEWAEVERVPLHADDGRNRARYSFTDRMDATCEYAVSAVDPQGVAGPKSVDLR